MPQGLAVRWQLAAAEQARGRTGDYLAVCRIRLASWLLYSIQGRAAAAAAAENAGCAASPYVLGEECGTSGGIKQWGEAAVLGLNVQTV